MVDTIRVTRGFGFRGVHCLGGYQSIDRFDLRMHHLNPAHATWHASCLYPEYRHATGALEDAQWIVEKYQAKEEEDAAAVLAGRSADNTAATDGPARSYGDEEGPSATRSNPWSDPSSDGSTAWSSASIAGGLDEFPQSEKTERVHNRRKGYGDLM